MPLAASWALFMVIYDVVIGEPPYYAVAIKNAFFCWLPQLLNYTDVLNSIEELKTRCYVNPFLLWRLGGGKASTCGTAMVRIEVAKIVTCTAGNLMVIKILPWACVFLDFFYLSFGIS